MDSDNFFKQHIILLQQIDNTFASLQEEYAKESRCANGCTDCCNACFDLSFIEACYLAQGVAQLALENPAELQETKKRAAAAGKILAARITQLEENVSQELLSIELAKWRVPCPMLSAKGRCAAYQHRPVTCRVYGVPTSILGKGHVCGLTGFDTGKTYPTVKLDNIFAYLQQLSQQAGMLLQVSAEVYDRRFFIHELILSESLANLLKAKGSKHTPLGDLRWETE